MGDGPDRSAWGDRFVLAVSWAATPGFDEVMLGWPGAPHPRTVTDLLLLSGAQRRLATD